MSQELPDKKALLNELRIDRNEAPEDRGRPLKWFLLIAVVAGIAFVLVFFQFPINANSVAVDTAIARAPVSAAAGASVLDATGYVVARRQATVSSKVTGKVMEVYIEEGVVVEQGQLLARLDDSIPLAQLRLAESQLEASRRNLAEMDVLLRQAELDLERTQGLAKRNLASRADLDRDGLSVEGLIARLARARQDIVVASRSAAVQRQIVDDMQIRAPFDGIVIAKAAQPGEMISPVSAGGGFTRTGICTIVDMDSLEVEVDVNEAYINRVYARQPVQITLNAYPDDHFSAAVIAIIPAADRNKATVRVRVGFLERDDRALPDMGVRVAFLDAETDTGASEVPAGVLVPSRAVAKDEAGWFVFVVADERVQRRAVTIGGKDGARSRVTTGLVNGERIVASLSEDVLATLDDGDAVVLAD